MWRLLCSRPRQLVQATLQARGAMLTWTHGAWGASKQQAARGLSRRHVAWVPPLFGATKQRQVSRAPRPRGVGAWGVVAGRKQTGTAFPVWGRLPTNSAAYRVGRAARWRACQGARASGSSLLAAGAGVPRVPWGRGAAIPRGWGGASGRCSTAVKLPVAAALGAGASKEGQAPLLLNRAAATGPPPAQASPAAARDPCWEQAAGGGHWSSAKPQQQPPPPQWPSAGNLPALSSGP